MGQCVRAEHDDKPWYAASVQIQIETRNWKLWSDFDLCNNARLRIED
jgi:hypothetical protein